MKATRMTASLAAVAALALTLAPVGSADAQQDKQNNQNWMFATAGFTTGLWNFDDPNNRFASSTGLVCGQDGSIWIRNFDPPRDIRAETQFGLASTLGIPEMPDGDGGVMRFPDGDQFMAYKMFPGIEANGGGIYVNQYTLIFDVLYPQSSNRTWRPFFNTNDCNMNDGDVFVNDTTNGIGISGVYDGTIRANRWHRVALAFNNPSETETSLDKYIDGVLVGSQILASGTDGRWSLYTASQGFATLLFADNNGETAVGYTSSVQIRDHTMTGPEIAALGGVSAAGIPGGAGVTGQWDFEDFKNGLAATTGNDLDYFDGSDCFSGKCEQNLGETTEFGTTTSFGIPDLPDGPADVMHYDAADPCTGYLFPHGALANGGGTRVNDYTIILDVYYTAEDWAGIPGKSLVWRSLYQSALLNNEDSMFWIQKDGEMEPCSTIGDDGCYAFTEGWLCQETWKRIVIAVNGDEPTGTTITKYAIAVDGTVQGPVLCDEGPGEPVDGKRSLWTRAEAGVDHLLFFANDDPFYTARGFVSSIQVRDYTMPIAEVQTLGGPRAAGIPIGKPVPECPPDCDPCDMNCDDEINAFDIEPFLTLLFDPNEPPCCGERGVGVFTGDVNGDGVIDAFDIEPFLSCLFP